MKTMDLWAELEWRGLSYQSTPDLAEVLENEHVTAYGGLEPSGDSLSVRNLITLIRLRWIQLAGHAPIALAGGGTGLIGDPSGREAERPLLSREQIDHNVAMITRELERLVDFSPGSSQARVVNNADWLTKLNLIEFLRDIGKHFTVNYMIAKESVGARLNREQGISYTEFSYMLLQAYDYLHLFDEYGCRLQVGGSDQWGNIIAGVDLIRRTRGKAAHAWSHPLVVESSGRIMSKSQGNAIYLSAHRTSPYAFYQYWINTDDADVASMLKLYTFLPRERIEELAVAAEREPARREAQRVLAEEVTRMMHGDDELARAERASKALFGSEIAELDEALLLEVLADAPSTTLPRSTLDTDLDLVQLMVSTGLASAKAAARVDIEQGGLYLNNRRALESHGTLGTQDLLHGRYLVVRKGKKNYHLVRFE